MSAVDLVPATLADDGDRWIRPGPRPSWGRRDVAWWWRVSDEWRLPVDDEEGRECSVPSCIGRAWLVRLDKYLGSSKMRAHDRRSFRCVDHVYDEGVLVEDGLVLVSRPRLDVAPPVGALAPGTTVRLIFDLTAADERRAADVTLPGLIDWMIARGRYQEIRPE